MKEKDLRDYQRPRKGLLLCAIAIFAAACLAFAGCANGESSSESGQAQGGLEEVTVVLDYVPNTNHTGLYAAIAQGYYAQEGLEVQIVQPPDDGADSLVASGKAQFGITFQDAMGMYLGSSEPLPVTAVAALVQHNTSGIMSRAGEGIDEPKGMTGKSYGGWNASVENAILKTIVNDDGGDWEEVEVLPMNATDEVAGLKTDMFDSCWVYEGWGLQSAKLQNFDVDYFAIKDKNATFDYYTPVIICNNEFLEQNPDVVKRFLAATEKGYEFAIGDPSQAADILLEAAPETDEDLARQSQEVMSPLYVDDAPYWGYIDPDRWNAFYSWMNEQQLTENPISENAGFTNDYLPGRQ